MSLAFEAVELAETKRTESAAATVAVEAEAKDTAIVWEKERLRKRQFLKLDLKMSAKVWSTEAIAAKATIEAKTSNGNNQIEIECAKCDCCALIEECTPGYIAKVRERYNGRWICGLCSEAVKDEMCRSKRLISTEEALNRHMSFSKSFRSSPPPVNSSEELISAMRQLLRKGFDSPRAARSTPASPRAKNDGDGRRALARAGSCFSKIAG